MKLMDDFQTETQLKELGDKLADDHKVAVEYALTELAQSQDVPAIQTLDNINAAWKTATEAMYAQGEQGQGEAATTR
jgi:molecular chaperone DnaK